MKTKTFLLSVAMFAFFISCQPHTHTDPNTLEAGMIKVTILYPNAKGTTFDMNYYTENHMPMVARLLEDAIKGWAIDEGIAGRTPEDDVPYLAIGYLYFDSLEAYQNAFAPHAKEIVSDIPNYTNSEPVIQISEVVK